AGAVARLEARPALAHDDLAARDGLAGEDLHAEALRVGVAAVAAGAEALLVCHGSLAPDLGDADAGELLPVAGAALVPALGLELEDAQLRAALVGDDLGRDRRLRERRGPEARLAVARQQQRLEPDGRADLLGQPLDEQGRPLLDAVLLAASLDDCVGHVYSVTSASAAAFARERRRPPLRPRRRGVEDSGSSPASSTAAGAVPASGGCSSVSACAAFFSASSRSRRLAAPFLAAALRRARSAARSRDFSR